MFVGLLMPKNRERRKKKFFLSKSGTLGAEIGERKLVVNMAH